MKCKVLAVAIAGLSANALALQGKVIDGNGQPVTSATVELVGKRISVSANSTGDFSFDDTGVEEIHVKAPGFSHRVVLLDQQRSQPIVVQLIRSTIEQVDVIGVPIHTSAIESAQPVSVLTGDELRNRQAATLGDTLASEMGVHTNFHGNVASTPIIRGLSGPRVLISQNSLDVSDVSRVGPDHAVSSEVSTAEQVEVLRGPATLFYGSGAIGGVVNVVDKRVPVESDTFGELSFSHHTVNSLNQGSFMINTGTEQLAFHLDGFWRESEDYTVPVAPELVHEGDHEDEHAGEQRGDWTVPNSSDTSSGFTVGSSYLVDNGYIGISFGKLDREYGIPGHSHGDEHGADAESVYADLKQDRFQLISELSLDNRWLSAINTRVGYTDYSHAEIEQSVVGTAFSNTTSELKLDVHHQPMGDLKGGVVFHYKQSEEEAEGEEAFTPPSKTQSVAVAVVEELHVGDFLFQAGARVEQVSLRADHILIPELEAHEHDDTHEETEHADDHEEHTIESFSYDDSFTPVSFSAGVVWDFHPGYNMALSFSHSERAPSAAELFSFGPHVGTRSYEIGALFDMHEIDHDVHFERVEQSLELEASNNIDLTFRKHEGDFGLILNAFYNQVDNYYYESVTGLYAEAGHDHEHEDEPEAEEDIHAEELPVYLYSSADATLHGFEGQAIWQISNELKVTVFSDYVHAKLSNNDAYLPRTPPLRYGARFDYQWNKLSAYVNWSHYNEQNNVAELETPTEGYDWVDVSATWQMDSSPMDMAFFVKLENITDTEARVHTSFLKDIAPKPGRNVVMGWRGSF